MGQLVSHICDQGDESMLSLNGSSRVNRELYPCRPSAWWGNTVHLGSPATCHTALFWCPLVPSVPPFCARYLVPSGVRQMWPLCGQSDAAPAFVRTTLGARTQPVFLLPHWQIYIRIKDDEWNVYRRYTEFRALHHQLQSTFPQVRAYSFPPKKAIGNKVCIHGAASLLHFGLSSKTALTTENLQC